MSMSQVICPVCFRFFSKRLYNPENKPVDIKAVQVRGRGRGRGVEVTETFSLLGDEEEDPVVELIANRIEALYYLLFEGKEESIEEEAQVLSDICDEIIEYFPDRFDNLADAAISLLEVYQGLVGEEEESEEDEDPETFEGAYDNVDNNDNEPESELERELRIGEKEVLEPV